MSGRLYRIISEERFAALETVWLMFKLLLLLRLLEADKVIAIQDI